MTIKESLVKRIEQMDEQELAEFDQLLIHKVDVPEEVIESRLAAWRGIYGLLSDQGESATFEKAVQRRPLFGGRTPDLEGDDTA